MAAGGAAKGHVEPVCARRLPEPASIGWGDMLVSIAIGALIGPLAVLGWEWLYREEPAEPWLAGAADAAGAGPTGTPRPRGTRWPRHHDLAWAHRHDGASRSAWYHDCDFHTVTWKELPSRTFLEPVVIRRVVPVDVFRGVLADLQAADPALQSGSAKEFATAGPDATDAEARSLSQLQFSEFLNSSNSTIFETVFQVQNGRKTKEVLKLPVVFLRYMQDYFRGDFQVQLLAATQKQGFTPHIHGEAFFVHVWGPKRWRVNKESSLRLFVDERTGLLNQRNISVESFASRLGTSECLLRPGDLLYLPHYYPHTVENIDRVTLGFQTIGSSPYLESRLIDTPGYFLHK